MKISCLGPRGTFSDEAAHRYYKGSQVDYHMCGTLIEVIEAVADNQADQGFVPIENSIEGSINITLDGIIKHKLMIQAEVIFPVSMHLLVNEGVQVKDVKEIWSIPPALAQCREFVRELKVPTKDFPSTSMAAEAIKKTTRCDVAAVGSEWAGSLFGLDIAVRNIEDFQDNQTRFFVVTKESDSMDFTQKSLLLINPEKEQAGVLSSILNVLSALGINLTWIESRPTKRKLGSYQFFMEVELGGQHPALSKTMTILSTLGHDVRLLGSYNSIKL
ncbi:prephenate dehydratase [Paenibacillus alginolyticus]|uniref:Prephenate dehydratase n=2 Tax=Paenibacillus alginolyticus TaxID=59839 RepID=A0ABT4GPQ1_9BACL|nr:prephenate dehydratase [Paenibacillus alginolyticus]MCY9698046.1 prephenate dehydratase [Paenibacillus alginolyticus]MEC0148963.1 prephenate dehydratase [Paenibacillus alginolyticus]